MAETEQGSAGNEVLATITQLELDLNAFLQLIRDKVCRKHGLGSNAGQALLLARMPEEGCRPGDVRSSHFYNGMNPSYNIAHLVERGFLTTEASEQDRRSCIIRLTNKGLEVRRDMIRILGESSPKKLLAT